MDFTEKTVSSERIFEGRVFSVRRDVASLPDGKPALREVVEHPGGVGIVPLNAEREVLMVRQFRYPLGRELLEIPAGKLEPGEDPFECAVRELSEETGCTAGKWIYLGENYPSPGFCRETLHIYLALKLTRGQAHLDEGEFLTVEKHGLDELIGDIMKNELRDGKTIIGLLKAALYIKGETCPEQF
jgi:ADP-ribose pyrophosphatase